MYHVSHAARKNATDETMPVTGCPQRGLELPCHDGCLLSRCLMFLVYDLGRTECKKTAGPDLDLGTSVAVGPPRGALLPGFRHPVEGRGRGNRMKRHKAGEDLPLKHTGGDLQISEPVLWRVS